MFIFYQNPYFDIIGAICGIATLMVIAGWGMSAIDDVYKVKDSLNIGVALVSTTIMLITMCILAFTDKTKDIALNTLDSNISVNKSMVTINSLPKNYFYSTLDNNTYHSLIDDHRPLREVGDYITVDSSKVTINELPHNYGYETLDNGKKLKSSEKQVFHYEENPNFDATYLVTEDGSRFKLSDEDREYLKERGVS